MPDQTQLDNNIYASSNQFAVSSGVNVDELKDSESDIIQEGLKRNRILFFGFPLFVVAYAFFIVIVLIYPNVIKYFDYRDKIEVLNSNYNNLKQTSENIQAILLKEEDITRYENRLLELIPSDSRLALLIDKIKQTASNYSLEQQVSVNIEDERGTINRLEDLTENIDYTELIDSLNSGEIKFSPNFLQTKDAEARLLIVSIRIKGTKTNFIEFLGALQRITPLVNVTSVSYREMPDYSGNTQVEVDLNLESFALVLKSQESITDVKKLNPDDPALLSTIPVENIEVNPKLIKEFEQQ